MTRAIAISIAIAWFWVMAESHASENPSWRASGTSERARLIASQLFPEKCGSDGSSCGIIYDDRRKCPFEFVVVFPARTKDEPPAAVVTLDKHGGVVEVSSIKKGSCGNDKS